ncbi:hypothetical protein [Enterobacter oligotrophicus]|uniref:hypothetical protein n=1 Tax=Enterobacter oligotrophicus TaxID=2478464 RepID=UPI0028ACA02F|nr:hypothetical protein [Enterobacter oligotrophicus]
MMNIRFNPEVFNALREEAARIGLSIPALVNAIVKNTILQIEEPNAKKEKTRT